MYCHLDLTGQVPFPQTPDKTTSKRLLVKKLPDTADEEILEMFFEHTKRQGDGPVKHVALSKADKMAVIEFQDADSVHRVLSKQPITMQGGSVEVERYTPYLDNDESVESIHLHGIPKPLAEDIATLKLKDPMQFGREHEYRFLTM